MRIREAVASALHLLVILSFFSLAAFLFFIPVRPDWRVKGIDWLQEHPESFYWVGALMAAMGLFFLYGFYGIGRGRFYRLSMKPHLVSVDTKLLEQAINECFQTYFPKQVRGSDIALVSKQRLEVAVDLLPLDEKRMIKLMADMEKKLMLTLRDRFGYTQPFTLSIHSK